MNIAVACNMSIILWALCLFSNSRNFNGEIRRSVHNDFSAEHEKMLLQSPYKSPPIARYELSEVIYSIHDDTLIVERIDGFGELNMVTIQIGDKVYSNSGNLSKIFSSPFADVSSFDHEMDLIEDWAGIGPNKIKGSNKRTEIEIITRGIGKYPDMEKMNRTFSELFYKGALIVEQKRSFQGSTRVMKNTYVQEKTINCKSLLEKYNFSL